MRSPSPRQKRPPPVRRPSPVGYKRPRSRSITPPYKRRGSNQRGGFKPRRRSSPRQRSRSRSPRRRSRSPRGRSWSGSPHRRHRSRSPRRRSRSPGMKSRSPGRRSKSPRKRSRTPRRRSRSPGRRSRSSSSGSRSSSSPKRKPSRGRRNRSRSGSPEHRFKPKPGSMDPRSRYTSGSQGNRNKFHRSQGFRSSPDSEGEVRQKTDTAFDPYRDNSGGRGDKDYRTLPPPQSTQQAASSPPPQATRPRERFDQTGITLSDRFLSVTGPLPPFSPTENITIGIERSIPGNMPAVVPRELFPAEVVIVRRKDEGTKPLYQRLEFLGPKEDVMERRTIKMAPTEEPKHKQKISLSPFKTRPLLTERWTVNQKESLTADSYKKQAMSREEMDNFLLNPSTSVAESSRVDDKDDRYEGRKASSRGPRTNFIIDTDERVVLEKRDKPGKADSFKFTINIPTSPEPSDGGTFDKGRLKFERDPNDLRHNLSKKKRRSPSVEKDDSFDARQKLLKKRESELKKREAELKRRSAQLEKKEKTVSTSKKGDEEDLPDFSARPGKHSYHEWQQQHPESIPKGSYYYEVKRKQKAHITSSKPISSQVKSTAHKCPDLPPRQDPDRNDGSSHRASQVHSFQHDNRDSRGRGRGRGGYRGRGRGQTYEGRGGYRNTTPQSGYRGNNYRGGYNNRGYNRGGYQRGNYQGTPGRRDSSPIPREWKHDKFQDVETEKQEKPSSTT